MYIMLFYVTIKKSLLILEIDFIASIKRIMLKIQSNQKSIPPFFIMIFIQHLTFYLCDN